MKLLSSSTNEMRQMGYQIVDYLVDHMQKLDKQAVVKHAEIDVANLEITDQGVPFDHLFQQLDGILSVRMLTEHPRFFAFVPGSSNYIGALADFLASGLNIFAGTEFTSPSAAAMEQYMIRWLTQLFTFPEEAGGLFVSGGSMANLVALTAARHKRLNNQIENAVIYYSDQTHYSIQRALMVLGFHKENLCTIKSDAAFRLSCDSLREQIKLDKLSGKIPFCVVANAGTTNTGAVDPLDEIATICRQEDIWFHVDGAMGAASMLYEDTAKLLIGIEQADSLTLDPHKWLFQPYDIGCVLVRDQDDLKSTFKVMPTYLRDVQTNKGELNYCDYGIELTRRFRALKLWMSMKVHGVSAFRQAIAHGVKLAQMAETLLVQAENWQVITKAQLGIVTFRYQPTGLLTHEVDQLNQYIVDQLAQDGSAIVHTTILDEELVIRMCTINPHTTEQDLAQTIEKLQQYAERHLQKSSRSLHCSQQD